MILPVLLIILRAEAAELQQPIPLYAAGVSTEASPGASDPPGSRDTCATLPPPTGNVDPGLLVIRDTDRPDVGPYTVTLPGYASDPSSSAQDVYRPFLITTMPGDTLRIDINNQLASNEALGGAVNLHTHGLITNPRPCTPLGDYIFVADQPGTMTSYRVDIPATLPGIQLGSQAEAVTYPSGLSWFHAHLHEKTSDDINAGQAGMIYIGDLRADLLNAPSIDPASAAALTNADIVYMGLRDIQLAVPSGSRPDNAQPGTRGQWLHGSDYNPAACIAYANPPQNFPGEFSGPGYCGHGGARIGGTQSPGKDTVWLYTVNGQTFPTDTMPSNRNQIWRIANLSADVTYVLELVDNATGQAQTLNVLSLDGVAAGTAPSGSSSLQVGVTLQKALLMPASRTEILVVNAGGDSGRTLTLRTTGITTGAAGSPWPAIDLAQVIMPAGSQAPAPSSSNGAATGVTMPGMAPSAPAPAPIVTADVAPNNCVTLPGNGQVTRRQIIFTTDPTGKVFEIGSSVVDANGVPIDNQHTIPPQAFPMKAMLDPESLPHICARLGTQEVWEIINESGELHNFHIHQDKFRLSHQSDPGVPPNLVALQDPANLIAQYAPETQAAAAVTNVDVWHDTFPLPPYGGRIFVTIPFYSPQQVGDFVYHCHILTHEDAGMMAVIQVFDPSQSALKQGSSQFADLRHLPVCGLPHQQVREDLSATMPYDEIRSVAHSAPGLVSGAIAGSGRSATPTAISSLSGQ
ncbi:MAG: multicopper oxidase domain-containing protein [Rhodospirillales bacterium]|nr:multicopper oxidase domain-containing protein [Acetobacter sp.]